MARNIGYLPKSKKAAAATISFFIDCTSIVPTPATITLKKGSVCASSGAFGGQSFMFSIVSDISVPVLDGIASFNELTVYQGTLLTSNFTYSSRTPNQRYILPNSGIDTSLIRVNVKGTEQSTTKVNYSVQDSLFDISSTSDVYYLQEISDERYELIFGDGVFGKALEEGNYITADYIVTSGDAANGVNQFEFAGRLSY